MRTYYCRLEKNNKSLMYNVAIYYSHKKCYSMYTLCVIISVVELILMIKILLILLTERGLLCVCFFRWKLSQSQVEVVEIGNLVEIPSEI